MRWQKWISPALVNVNLYCKSFGGRSARARRLRRRNGPECSDQGPAANGVSGLREAVVEKG
jgi:hypothetical protein